MRRRAFLQDLVGAGAAVLSPCAVSRASRSGTASALRAVGKRGPCLVRIEAPEASAHWDYRIPEGPSCDEGVFKTHAHPILTWKHDPDGTVSHEWETNDADFKVISAYSAAKAFGLVFIQGIRYRVSLTPAASGLDLAFTARNVGKRPLHNISGERGRESFPDLRSPPDPFSSLLA